MVEFPYKRRHKQREAARASNPERGGRAPPAASPASANKKVCFSFAAYACTVIAHLSKCNIPISRGLSDEEVQQIQSRFGFDFPPDLRSILQEGLPVGVGFPDWRSASDKHLLSLINLPVKGLCHEVSKRTFWCQRWGPRPDGADTAVRVAQQAFKMAPVLVPIYSHCYIPCFPNSSGNPILFVFEKDVFYCGYDLADFFEREVFIPLRCPPKSLKREAAMAPKPRRQEKQTLMSSVKEEMAMESRSNGSFYDGHHHNPDGIPQKGRQVQKKSLHRWSAKEADWKMLNQRLLAELQNADADDQWSHSKEGSVRRTQHGEVPSRKSLSDAPHAYERPPRSLVRSAGNSPRLGQHIMSRYAYFHEKPLPAKVLAQFTIAAPPWAAKAARHIPLWSELVENKETSTFLLHDPDVAHRRDNPQESDMLQLPSKESSLQAVDSSKDMLTRQSTSNEQRPDHHHHHHAQRQDRQGARIGSGRAIIKRWLVPYFEDMEKRLRRGGWNEDEIEEMMVAALPPGDEFLVRTETRGEIRDALDASANAMSLSLQKAGWSAPDVFEILSLEPGNHIMEGLRVDSLIESSKSDLKMDKTIGSKLSGFLRKT